MITTCTLWVCSKCGAVSHVDGGVQPTWSIHNPCMTESGTTMGKHSLKPVLVMVPYA